MSTPRRKRGLFVRFHEDDGIGMILVIGVTTFVTALAATAAIIAVNGLSGSRQRTAWEQSLSSAEAGVDFALARLQRAWDDSASDYPIPNTTAVGSESNPFCNASAVTAPTFATADAERTWAKGQLATLAAAHPECIQTTGSGQWLVFKPRTALVGGLYPRYGRIYSIGWAPSKAKPTATRMIKSEYIFMPYRPVNAILTGKSLDISSSVYVSTVTGTDPKLAMIHSNGTITGTGNPTSTGEVSSSSTSTLSSNNFTGNTAGKVVVTPQQPIPFIDAESFYKKAPQNDANSVKLGNWFDLCPDGSARPYSTDGKPCNSPTLSGSGIGGSSFRGWNYSAGSSTWTATKDTQSGVYFAYQADVVNGVGNASIPNLTVIASAKNPDNCGSKQYGNVTWDHYNMQAPAYRNLFIFADSDILTTSNVQYGSGATTPPVISGMFVAGDQINMETSSQSAVGSVVASDQCTTSSLVTSNQVKNLTVYFDPNSDSPFTSIITTTLWAEIPAAG